MDRSTAVRWVRWTLGETHQIACLSPFEAWPVPPDVDFTTYKNATVERWCANDGPRRERLITALSAFLTNMGLTR